MRDPESIEARPVPPAPGVTAGRGALLMAVCLASALAAGCGSTYLALAPEQAVPEFATLTAAASGLPQQTALVPVGQAGGRPVRLAVHETGTGDRDRVIVLVH